MVRDGSMWHQTQASLRRIGTGFGLAIVVGVPLGAAITWYRSIRRTRRKQGGWRFARVVVLASLLGAHCHHRDSANQRWVCLEDRPRRDPPRLQGGVNLLEVQRGNFCDVRLDDGHDLGQSAQVPAGSSKADGAKQGLLQRGQDDFRPGYQPPEPPGQRTGMWQRTKSFRRQELPA